MSRQRGVRLRCGCKTCSQGIKCSACGHRECEHYAEEASEPAGCARSRFKGSRFQLCDCFGFDWPRPRLVTPHEKAKRIMERGGMLMLPVGMLAMFRQAAP